MKELCFALLIIIIKSNANYRDQTMLREVEHRIDSCIAKHVIDFDRCEPIDCDGMHYLCQKDTHNVIKLILNAAFYGDEPLQRIMTPNFSNLITVELKQNFIGNLGCKYISKCNLKSMQKLSLASNQIDTSGVIHLQKTQWRLLSSFSLYGNLLADKGIKALTKANWRRLQTLCLKRNLVNLKELTQLLNIVYSISRLYVDFPKVEGRTEITTFILSNLSKFHLEDMSFD